MQVMRQESIKEYLGETCCLGVLVAEKNDFAK